MPRPDYNGRLLPLRKDEVPRRSDRRSSQWLAFVTALALLAASLAGCGPHPADPGPRLVLLYVTCSLNRDHLSPFDPAVDFTPNLGRFGEESAVFWSHQTESGLSGTAYASIFAGVQADRHGVFKHPRRLDDELHLIFEAFAEAGYEPFYWAGHPMSAPRWNYAQGVPAENTILQPLEAGDERFRSLLRRLEEDESYRALVVTAFTVTHGPYSTENLAEFQRAFPDRVSGLSAAEIERFHRLYEENYFLLQTRFAQTVVRLGLSEQEVAKLAQVLELVYASRVHALDDMFGALRDSIAASGVAEDALIAFTADHGEILFRDDALFQWTHGPDLAPEVIEVPLMIRGHAGVVAPGRIDSVTRSIDVYPTLAGLAGVAMRGESRVQGADLSRALRGEEPFPELHAESHGTLRQWSFFKPDLIQNIWVASRRGDLRYTWRRPPGGRWELDVRHVDGRTPAPGAALDPDDPRHKEAAKELWVYRERMIEAFHARFPEEAQSQKEELGGLRDDELEALRSLGYIE